MIEIEPVVESLKRDITKVQRALVRRARKNGLYENFGQKEARALADRYARYANNRTVRTELLKFEEWCWSYTGRE